MPQTTRAIKLRRPDACATCGSELSVGERAIWDSSVREVRCLPCGDTWSGRVDPRASVAGESARREYERRRDARVSRVRGRYGVFGGVAAAVSAGPQHERSWAKGGEGEVKVGRVLDKRTAGHGVVVLHDRRLPGTRANIDHIAVGRCGVFVIDAKRYSGRIAVERRGGLLRPRTEHLLVGGRDRTKLVESVLEQAETVRGLLARTVTVTPVLCFVDGDWPFMPRLEVRGVPILWPRRAAALCRGDGPLGPAAVEAIAGDLARALPAA